MRFTDILELAAGDVPRRKAALETLLVAETLTIGPSESRELIGSETGEVRAWARHVLKSYSAMGVTAADQRIVGRSLYKDLRAAWDKKHREHRERSLDLYQDRAAELRGLAKFERSASCGSAGG